MENVEYNNLFFVCSLIEYISRKTRNTKKYVVQKLGRSKIQKMYNLADVYHSENIDKICYELITESNIEEGNYVLNLINGRPTYWELGRVYQRLILKININPNSFVDNIMLLFNSFLIPKLDNYGSSLYYENIDYLYECFIENRII